MASSFWCTRQGAGAAAVWLLWTLLSAAVVFAGSLCETVHPLAPPDARFTGRCPNCGMPRAMWARTWATFQNDEGRYGVCSLHCLADISRKSGLTPRNVKVALYLAPTVMVPAANAFFVLGSSAPGTMTAVSKPAFADRTSAKAFAAACGGRVTTWTEAYSTALMALGAENRAIAGKRLKTGKIVLPRDRVDECAVCGMYPARYDKNRAQIRTRAGKTLHFCSTQCLFKFLKDPRCFEAAGPAPGVIWVTDFASGRWISGRTAYYVLHSRQWGPMGYEAFAFDSRAAAESFIGENGGRWLPFSEVRIEKILSPR